MSRYFQLRVGQVILLPALAFTVKEFCLCGDLHEFGGP